MPRKRELIEKAEIVIPNSYSKSHIDQDIIENAQIYDNNDLYDTFVLTESLVQDIDKLMTLFGIISDDQAFTKPCK